MASRAVRLGNFDVGGPLLQMIDTGSVDAASGEPIYAWAGMDINQSGAPVKFASVAAAIGTTDLVAAVASKKIRCLAFYAKPLAGGSIQYLSNATPLGGVLNFVASVVGVLAGTDGSILLPYCPVGWFETVAGDPLKATITGSAVPGMLVYQEVTP